MGLTWDLHAAGCAVWAVQPRDGCVPRCCTLHRATAFPAPSDGCKSGVRSPTRSPHQLVSTPELQMRGSETRIHDKTELPSAPFHKSGALLNNSTVFVNSIPLGMRKAVVNAAHVEWAAGITNAIHNFSQPDLEQGCGHGFNSVRVRPASQLFRHDGLNLSAPVLSMLLICINKYKLGLQCQLW